jgi:hypothetical protein
LKYEKPNVALYGVADPVLPLERIISASGLNPLPLLISLKSFGLDTPTIGVNDGL